MEISEFTLKLIILLIPGGVSAIIYEKLTIKKKWSPFQFVANSIIFGGISYIAAQLILGKVFEDESLLSFWDNLPAKEIPFNIVVKATGFSILIGFLGAGLDKFKVINRIATLFGLSTKYGDENLFTYFMGSKQSDEIYVRDLATNQTYHGMVLSFSETDEFKEIVLRDVKVYDYESSTYLYDIAYVYLSRSKDLLTLEVYPSIVQTNNNGTETSTETTAEN
jgi:hypothetical protein